MLPDEDGIIRRAEELYRSWTLVEDGEPQPSAAIALADLMAFLGEGRPLSHEQQRALFTDARLRATFQSLRADFALASGRPSASGAAGAQGVGPRPLELPAQIAAASASGPDFQRPFDGGSLKVAASGVGEEVYIVITLDDPLLAPRALLIEAQGRNKMEQMALPPRDGDGEIVLIKNLSEPADAAVVEMLRDPTATGLFLR